MARLSALPTEEEIDDEGDARQDRGRLADQHHRDPLDEAGFHLGEISFRRGVSPV